MRRQTIPGRTIRDRCRNSPTRGLFSGPDPVLLRERDAQQSRVYRSEVVLWEQYPAPELSWEETVSFIRGLEESAWWATSAKTAVQERAALEYAITLRKGSPRERSASARPDVWEIRMPEYFRRRWVVIHEMAHLISPDWGHGPAWVEVYLDGLAAAGLEDAAVNLSRSMIRHGVKGAKTPDYYRAAPVEEYPADGRLFPLDTLEVFA